MVKELLLGDNPFIGVSHLAHEKSRETLRELTIEKKVKVIEAVLEAGATGFTFSTHPENLELLKYLRKNKPNLLNKLSYYILVPYATGYVREATKVGLPRLIKKILVSSLSIGTWTTLIFPKPVNVIKLFIEAELRDYMKLLPRGNVKAVLLHEVLTELIAAFDLGNVVRALRRHFQSRGVGFGLETRNIGFTKEFLERSGLDVNYIMTPLNPLGYQMTPSKEEAERAIISLSRRGVKVVGINVLASGAVPPDTSLAYLQKLRDYIYAVAFGTSNPQRGFETTLKFRSLVE